MRLQLEVRGTEALAKDLTDLGQRLQRPVRPLLQGAAALMQTWFQGHIRSEQGPDGPWPALHPATQAIRSHYGWPAATPKLIRSGDLLHSIQTLDESDESVTVGTRASFAEILHTGGEVADRGRRRTVQAFPFVFLAPLELDDLRETIVAYFFEET